MVDVFLVGLGGFFGSLLRYYMGSIVQKKIRATFFVNVTGAVLLACLIHFYRLEYLSENLWLFAGVGFSGAYTTFSTFGYETLQLLLNDKYKIALLYVSSSFLLSIVLVYVVLQFLSIF